MQKNTNFNDDLIGGGQEPIIIQQGGGSDKKFIYTILILLVILFIIVLGVVIYFGSKFFATSNTSTQTPAKQVQQVAPQSVQAPMQEQEQQVQALQKEPPKKEELVTQTKEETKPQESDTLAELESIVNENTPKAQEKKEEPKSANKIEQAVNKATGGVKLAPEDLQKIAQLVAQQLAQSSKAKNTNAQSSSNQAQQQSAPVSDEEALVQSLQAASTDTLTQETIDETQIKTNQHNKKIGNSSNKKIDTFNKVVVERNQNTEDEFAKLSQEIDSILQSEDAQKVEKKAEEKLANIVETRKQELRFIVVRPGDTLGSIARRAYGRASAYIKIYKANPDLVKNPNRIYVGQRLRVPVDSEYQGNAR